MGTIVDTSKLFVMNSGGCEVYIVLVGLVIHYSASVASPLYSQEDSDLSASHYAGHQRFLEGDVPDSAYLNRPRVLMTPDSDDEVMSSLRDYAEEKLEDQLLQELRFLLDLKNVHKRFPPWNKARPKWG